MWCVCGGRGEVGVKGERAIWAEGWEDTPVVACVHAT